MEAASSLRQEHNVPIPAELVIIPNPEIQAIINDESLVWGVEGAGPTKALGGEETTSAALSSTKEPSYVNFLWNFHFSKNNSIVCPTLGAFILYLITLSVWNFYLRRYPLSIFFLSIYASCLCFPMYLYIWLLLFLVFSCGGEIPLFSYYIKNLPSFDNAL